MNQTKNDLHVTHIASGDLWAGAEVQLYTLCTTLNYFNDVKVSVVLFNHGTLENKLRKSGIHVEVIDESKFNALLIFSRLVKTLKRLNPNIVHTHRVKENILGSLASQFVGLKPSIRTVHGAPEHRPSFRKPHKCLLLFLDWFCARYLQSAIVAVSEDLEHLLKRSYPLKKIVTIENGIDTHNLYPFPSNTNAIQKEKQTPFKVGLVGRLVPVKRVDLYIEAARYLKLNYPDLPVHFHIYGDGPLLENLKQLSNSLVVSDIVSFEGHCNTIHQEIASLDALLITSDHEGLPMTLLEALALGTPVIAHSVGGITKACKDGECCWLISNNAPQIIAEKLLECLKEKSEIKSTKIDLARSHIDQYYSAQANALQIKTTYQNVLNKEDNIQTVTFR